MLSTHYMPDARTPTARRVRARALVIVAGADAAAHSRHAHRGDAAAGGRGALPLKYLDGIGSLLSAVQGPVGAPVTRVVVGEHRGGGRGRARSPGAPESAVRLDPGASHAGRDRGCTRARSRFDDCRQRALDGDGAG